MGADLGKFAVENCKDLAISGMLKQKNSKGVEDYFKEVRQWGLWKNDYDGNYCINIKRSTGWGDEEVTKNT